MIQAYVIYQGNAIIIIILWFIHQAKMVAGQYRLWFMETTNLLHGSLMIVTVEVNRPWTIEYNFWCGLINVILQLHSDLIGSLFFMKNTSYFAEIWFCA